MGGVLQRLRRCACGATAIEYSLIAALIAVAMLAAVQTFGLSLSQAFQVIADALMSGLA